MEPEFQSNDIMTNYISKENQVSPFFQQFRWKITKGLRLSLFRKIHDLFDLKKDKGFV